MRSIRLLVPLALCVSLAACDAYAPTPNDAATGASSAGGSVMSDAAAAPDDGMAAETASSSSAPAAMADGGSSAPGARVETAGSYGAYSPSVLRNGQKKVLFFHAAWCPTCKHADAQLTAWYATHPFPLSTYKVDYDTEKELKATYGVTYQHTFVLVDGEGKALKIMEGPTDAQIQALLQS